MLAQPPESGGLLSAPGVLTSLFPSASNFVLSSSVRSMETGHAGLITGRITRGALNRRRDVNHAADRRRSKCVDMCMQSKWSPPASRSAYFARQIPRLLWYVGHGYVMSRLAERAHKQNGNSKRPEH